MCASLVRDCFVPVAVNVNVLRSVAMSMLMKVDSITPKLPEHINPEADQHHTDGGFKRQRQALRDRVTQKNGCPGEDEQGERMSEPPGEAVLDDIADFGSPGGDAGDRSDMISLERMLHAEQEPQPQNPEHQRPAFPGRRYFVAFSSEVDADPHNNQACLNSSAIEDLQTEQPKPGSESITTVKALGESRFVSLA